MNNDYSTALSQAQNGTTKINFANRFGQVVNVADFGAKCDGVTNDAPAINAAIAFIKTRSQQSYYKIGTLGRLVFPSTGTQCLVTSPVNATSPATLPYPGTLYGNGFIFDMSGASLLCQTGTGTACIDATGTGQAMFINISLYGSQTNEGSVGLAIGRVTNNGNGADHNYIQHIVIAGYWKLAAFFNNQSETTLIDHADFSNSETNAYGAIYDGLNHFNFQTIATGGPYPQNTFLSFNENTCNQCIIEAFGVGSVPLWIGGTARHKFINLFADASPASATTPVPGVILYFGNSMTNTQLDLDMHLENDGAAGALTSGILFAGASNITFQGLHLRDNYTEQSGPLLKRDTAGTYGTAVSTVNILDFKAEINYQAGTGATFFDTPNSFYISDGDVTVGDGSWQVPGVFFGNLSVFGAVRSDGEFYTLTSLPVCGTATKFGKAWVTNAPASPGYLSVINTGTTGTTIAPVFCNGTNWIYH